jgi:hypothetical protein
VLSVGQLGLGKSVDVVAEMEMPLAMIDGVPFLRIPTTVGQLYGSSPLLPSDDLTANENALQTAELRIRVGSGSPRLFGGRLVGEDTTMVPLDRAIEISVPGANFGTRQGYDAKGRSVRLSLTPAAAGEGRFDASILFDRSGSTDERISGDGDFPKGRDRGTVWTAMKSGLEQALAELRPADLVSLWQFNDACQSLGASSGTKAAALVRKIEKPSGGTELEQAIETALAVDGRDVLVVTDGKIASTP